MSTSFQWTAAIEQELRRLWADPDMSMSRIGAYLGISKNAVVGKVHRLKLTARLSPIDRSGRGPSPCNQRRPIPRAPARTILESIMPVSVNDSGGDSFQEAEAMSRRGLRARDGSGCVWPIGTPGRPDFRFCDADFDADAPARCLYCAEHRRRAYQNVPVAAAAPTAGSGAAP